MVLVLALILGSVFAANPSRICFRDFEDGTLECHEWEDEQSAAETLRFYQRERVADPDTYGHVDIWQEWLTHDAQVR